MAENPSEIVVPAPRFTAVVLFGLAALLIGVSLFTSGDGMERLLGIPAAIAGALALGLMFWGETRVSFGRGCMRVRAVLGSRVLSERSYALENVQSVRIDEAVYMPFAPFRSASGLPFRLDAWNPPVRFEYEGSTIALGDGLDAEAREKLREAIAAAAGEAHLNTAGLTGASS